MLTHAKNRALREEMYRAYVTRASTGDNDNTPLIDKVLSLRGEKAKLLGFDNFAQLSMASKVSCCNQIPHANEKPSTRRSSCLTCCARRPTPLRSATPFN